MPFDPVESFFQNIKKLRSDYYYRYDSYVINFFKYMCFRINLFKDYKSEIDKFIAFDFNVFDYINPSENLLSDILADLLNPKGNHGQGYLFLSAFLSINNSITAAIKQYDAIIRNAKIYREESTSYIIKSHRRIDITINFDNFAIGIENKPWAIEQEDQMKDYKEHLKKKYKDRYILIFISGNPNSEPKSLGGEIDNLKKGNKLIIFSYPFEIKKWILSCHKECSSEKIRWFLHDFTKFIETNFQLQ